MDASSKKEITAIVLSPVWPSSKAGYGIAVQSALLQYLKIFANVHLIAFESYPFADSERWNDKPLIWSQIPVNRRPKWFRFLKSLFTAKSATTIQFPSNQLVPQLIEMVDAYEQSNRSVVIIIEDIPLAHFIDSIHHRFPAIPIAVHSHNVLTKAFEEFAHTGNWFGRIAWKLEVAKIRKLELNVLKSANRYWSISKTDSQEYIKRFAVKPHGTLGVSIDIDLYADIPNGDIFTVLYLGSIDLRKAKGMRSFIKYSWKEINRYIPSTKFLLAGRNTEQFTNAPMGVYGVGFQESEIEFLGKGLIFVNPQENGSGVKLKSIVAMLAGKALVSTEVGIEGIEGHPGEHFLVAKTAKELGPLVLQLINNPEQAIEIGKRAKQLARKIYNENYLSTTIRPLLEEFSSLTAKKAMSHSSCDLERISSL